MSSTSTIILTGHIAQEPEEIPGKDMLKFRIPVSYGKDSNKRTDWYTVFLKHSSPYYSMAPYLKKGSCVVVIGDFSPSIWYENEHKQAFMNLSVFAGIIKFGAGALKDNKHKDSGGDGSSNSKSDESKGETAQEIFRYAPQGNQYEPRKSNIVTTTPPETELPF